MSTTTTSITITRKVEYPFTPSEDGLEHSSPINLQTAPFDRGSWRLFYFYDGYQLTYGVRWTGVHGAQAHFAPGTLALDSFVTQQLVTGQLNGAAGEVTGDYYAEDWSLEPTCISLSITEEVPEAAVVRGERVAEGYAIFLSSQHPNDVQFYFPRVDRQLWASSPSLANASPYFKTLFSSGFGDGKLSRKGAKRLRAAAKSAAAKEATVGGGEDDSDNEFPELEEREDMQEHNDEESCSPIRRIEITGTAWRTYRAVLCWIYTSHIDFAPLASTYPPPISTSASEPVTRRDFFTSFAESHPLLPLPASPKSVYRLAHFLEIPDLQELALASIKAQIRVSNVATELFGDLSMKYEKVQELELDFAVANWKAVRESDGLKEIQALIEAGELPSAAAISLNLARRLTQ